MDADAWIHKLSNDLHLKFYEQDWSLVNGVASRVNEFIAYYYKHPEYPGHVRAQVFELIIASHNEAMLEGTVVEENTGLFIAFIREHSTKADFAHILKYWTDITNNEEFPVGNQLKDILNV